MGMILHSYNSAKQTQQALQEEIRAFKADIRSMNMQLLSNQATTTEC